MDKYNETKIVTGIKTIQRLSNELEENGNEDLRDHLWKLQREAALLMELIDEEIYAEEELRKVV